MTLSTPDRIFDASRLRDGWLLGQTKTNLAVPPVARAFLPAIDVAIGPALGVVSLDPYDGLEVFFTGTGANNTQGGYLLSHLDQLFDPDSGEPTGLWMEKPIAFGTVSLGVRQATAGEAALVAGLDTNDRLADTITESLALPGIARYSPANDTVGYLRVPALGAERMSVRCFVATATTIGAFVRRIQGDAQRH